MLEVTPSNNAQVEWLFELEADPEVSANTEISCKTLQIH